MLVGLADSPTMVAVDASATSWTAAETVFAETVVYAARKKAPTGRGFPLVKS
jgi:hypothetical protein